MDINLSAVYFLHYRKERGVRNDKCMLTNLLSLRKSIAETGLEPISLGHEPNVLPLHYSALKKKELL